MKLHIPEKFKNEKTYDVNLSAEDLINFELRVKEEYEKATITGPVHMSKGNEEELIEITDDYIKKLRNSQATVDQSDIVELMSMVIDSFGFGNQEKLSVLQGIKEATIR